MIVSVHILLALILVAEVIHRDRASLETLLENRAEDYTLLLVESIRHPLMGHDLVALENILILAGKLPDVEDVYIVDSLGQVLGDLKGRNVGKFMVDPVSMSLLVPEKTEVNSPLVLRNSREVIEYAAPVQIEGVFLGWIRVSLSKHSTRAAVWKVTQETVFVGIAAILAGSVMAFILGNSLTRRLRMLQDSLAAFRQGTMIPENLIRGRDEIAGLANALHSMSKEILEHRKVQEKSEERLKKEVALRTVELEEQTIQTRKSLEELDMIVDNIPGLVFYKDNRNNYIRVNRVVAERYGKTKEEINGTSLFDHHEPDLARKYWEDDRKVLESGEPLLNIEEPFVTSSGTRWVLTSKIPIYTNGNTPVGLLGIAMDITEQKELSARFEAVVHNSPIGMILFTHNAEYSLSNPAFYTITGVDHNDLNRNEALYLLDGDKRIEFSDLLKDASCVLCEFELERKEQKNIWVMISTAAIDFGGTDSVLCLMQDITRQKRLEAERQHNLQQLEVKNKELEQFAYVASHDLRSPLRGIETIAGWMEEDLGEGVSPEISEHLSNLKGRISRMDRLLSDLLEYARIGSAEVQISKVDVEKEFREIMELLDVDSGFSLHAENLPVFMTDLVPFRQVLNNLLGNAVKHHGTRDGTISFSAVRGPDFYNFTVKDDGPGIPLEYHEKIFEIFHTLKSRDEVEGSGMGLAMIKRIVEKKGGEVVLRSEPGQGSEFEFTWPVEMITGGDDED